VEPTQPTPATSTTTTPLAAQQAAIQDVRARYERGDIEFETFRRALDALVLAQNADECQVILRELPASPGASLAILERPHPLATTTSSVPRKRMVAFMGQVKKLRRPWKLAPESEAVAFMGGIRLDLRKAEIPPQAKMRVRVIMGDAMIFVPRNVRVTVRSTVLLSDTNMLGEGASGVVTSGHEEHIPTTEPAASQLEIDVFVLMGNVKVILADGQTVSISEMVREALQAAADGFRRGLLQGSDRERLRLARPSDTASR